MHINFTIFEQKLPENIAQLTIFVKIGYFQYEFK